MRGAPGSLACAVSGPARISPPAAGPERDVRQTVQPHRIRRRIPQSGPGLPPPVTSREDQSHGHQGHADPAGSGIGLFARRGLRLRGNRCRPAHRRRLHRPRQPGGGHQQRHRGAGPGRYRPAGQQAGDGRQGRAVPEVRRHRRVRYRDRRARSGQAGRDHRQPGAHLRRHQPRGHQGAGVLHRRAQAARAAEDPGVPRRPAWHRDHRRRGGGQRAGDRRQEDRGREARHHRRRCGRHRLPGHAGGTRPEAGEHHRVRPRRRDPHRPR